MKIQIRYLPYLLLAILALLLALWAGLLRLGWSLPSFPNLALAHGPLMISGFLGVLIPLERAVAMRHRWMFLVPILSGLGWLSLLLHPNIGIILTTLGSLGTLAILLVMVKREPQLHTLTMAIGTLAWVIGNFLWLLGTPLYQLIHWWMSFLILTIGGERIELNRVLRPKPTQTRLFTLLSTGLLIGALTATQNFEIGARLSGLSILALSLWFLKNDLATRNINHPNPLTRYIAQSLFGGFIWLGIGGAIQLWVGATYAGPLYDAVLHTIFVGFVMMMIFGHAPIIFPAILGVPVQYRPAFKIHLTLLHFSLILRITGDLAGQTQLRQWGGLLNEVAILLFLAATVYSIVNQKTKEP